MKKASRRASQRRIQWDDLQYILAVADTGSLAGAAAALRVNRTTVLRRVNSFERLRGVRLFERLPGGYELTPAGEELRAAALGLENTIATLERRLTGQDQRPQGTVHLTTSDTLLDSLLAEPLVAFQKAHPGITVEVSTSNTFLNLSRRDADVAIRPVADPPQELIGRRICDIAFAIYAANGHPDIDRTQDGLSGHRWIAPDETLAGTSIMRWMRQAIPETQTATRLDSLVGMRHVCAAGGGLAALPCYVGDLDSRLVRVHPHVKEMTTELWVLTHPDLAGTTRVRLFVDFVLPALKAHSTLLEGRRPRLRS